MQRSGFEAFEAPNGSKKLRCKLTGHEFPDRQEALDAHLKSRRYLIAAARVPPDEVNTYAQHYIVPSKGGGHGRGVLYCTLTKTHLNAVKEELDAHVHGRRYQAALGWFSSFSPSTLLFCDDLRAASHFFCFVLFSLFEQHALRHVERLLKGKERNPVRRVKRKNSRTLPRMRKG